MRMRLIITDLKYFAKWFILLHSRKGFMSLILVPCVQHLRTQQSAVLFDGSVKFLYQLIEYYLHRAGHFTIELSSVFYATLNY
jgi:hypothetical protein